MPWTLTPSLDDYLAAAGAYLRARAVEHTVQLSVVETLLARGLTAFGAEPPLFGWWTAGPGDGAIAATMFQTPPYPLLLSGTAEAIGPLAAALAAWPRSLPGVNAPDVLAAAFAAAWQDRTGSRWAEHRRMRLFVLPGLAALADPRPVPSGAARLASPADAGLLRQWLDLFAADTGEGEGDDAAVADRIAYGGFTIWADGGVPVALAGTQRPAAGIIRVGPVFTPAEQRRRGYGGAVTAAASRSALAAGAEAVVLFTDLANPTSNALYRRLGYQPVSDRTALAFSPPATSPTCS
jgi:GNAT superfamily N-acetyltransferase